MSSLTGKGSVCVVELEATSPFDVDLPVRFGTVEISVFALGALSLVAPFDGQRRAVSAALKDALGVGLPSPNRVVRKGSHRAIWTGPDQALVAGPLPALDGRAAVSDQSDAWASLQLTGPGVEEVLARLVPIDLRPQNFKTGHTARTLVGHMAASVTRVDAKTIEVMVMRSMAGTLVHELSEAVTGFFAR